jgi:hypothetical protein
MPPVELHATPAESPAVIENGAKAAPADDSPHQGVPGRNPYRYNGFPVESVTPPIMRSKLAGAVPVGARFLFLLRIAPHKFLWEQDVGVRLRESSGLTN